MKRLMESGKIVTTHGIKGEVKIDPWCDTPLFLCEFKTLYFKDGTELKVERARVHKNGVIIKFAGFDTMDDALRILNKIICIDKESVTLDEGVFFIEDLIGVLVTDADTGEEYGKITEVITNAPNDVYAVENMEKRIIYIPGIAEVVKKVDIKAGRMFIKPIEGLIE